MDVLRPPLLRVGGRVYRVNPVREPELYPGGYEEEEREDEEEVLGEEEEDAADGDGQGETGKALERTDRGYRCSLHMPSAFFKYVIGRKGETKRRLESDTRCSVTIPRMGTEGPVVVCGESRSSVLSACSRVELLVSGAREREAWTHFVCLPLGTTALAEGLGALQHAVTAGGAGTRSQGFHVSMFQSARRLHLTLGTLVLLSAAEVEAARQQLQAASAVVREVLGDVALHVALRGLEFMNDDPAVVDVLYAQIHSHGDRLQRLADRLVEHFVASGLMVRERQRVKLHATVINTLYRKGEGRPGGEPRPQRAREAFDAREILKEFGSFDFGELRLSSVEIYQRGSTDPSGAYVSCGSLPLPGGPDHE
ncbi:activating signal cointegrator 1 complex subunit 1 [Petromyzon marinus]|uniref:Activating signal cointegrator 1 complex subunit 1 n=1 Tax=Petromyzon marinus TaxID=7757 RepID=A0AAJ7UHT1_PETMA|nr:activating signal cointegrator 1 complex subunit 1 [Petromyzon marinus]